jgi:hypothetical protein
MTIYDDEHLQTLVLVGKPTLVREDAKYAVYQGMGRGWCGCYTIVWRLPAGVNPSEDNLRDPNAIAEIVDMADTSDL